MVTLDMFALCQDISIAVTDEHNIITMLSDTADH